MGLSLPDNPPAFAIRPDGNSEVPGITEVHRFVVKCGIARQLNMALKAHGEALHAQGTGVHRSNIGGFHSAEELFTGSSSEWYGPLHNVVLEALRMIQHGGSAQDGVTADHLPLPTTWSSVASMQTSGWLNASAEYDFNTLHDHGDALWSAVYYVDDGCTADEPAPFLAGALLLKTQLTAWKSNYAYLPVTPRPGDLWLFPSYMPHAVLPRSLPPKPEYSDATTSAEAETAVPPPSRGSLRISVACNIFRRSPGIGTDKPAAEVVMRRLLRRVDI